MRNRRLSRLATLAAAGLFIANPFVIAADQPLQNDLEAPGTIMVHLFEWRWNDIAAECESLLGPSGIDAVQVSPPNEHIALDEVDGAWWARYQPVSYRLESRSGDRAAFIAMVERCRAAGVGIVVDAVINHMAGIGEGQGIAGTRFTPFRYGDLYTEDDFHHCGRHGNDQIQNYQDRWEVQHCHLLGLADLATEKAEVRKRLTAYLQSLVDLGVAGFRIDAAKHIPPEDIAAILDGVEGDPYVFQEVIDLGGEPITVQDYLANGDVTEFRYGRELSRAMMSGDLAQLKTLGNAEHWVPDARALVFVDNHDNQRGHGAGAVMMHAFGERYRLGVVFMLAWPYGTPRIMSSYTFDGSDQGPPTVSSDGDWHTARVHGESGLGCLTPDSLDRRGWVCEHRWPMVRAMVGFRDTVGDAPVEHWQQDGESRIAFARGARGFLAMNRSDHTWQTTLETTLPPGHYCDVLADDCSRPITVDSDGQARLNVPSNGAVALHIGRETH